MAGRAFRTLAGTETLSSLLDEAVPEKKRRPLTCVSGRLDPWAVGRQGGVLELDPSTQAELVALNVLQTHDGFVVEVDRDSAV